jgi:plasmid stability protein
MNSSSILIRDLPLQTKAILQALALKNERSMAEEARQILNKAAARAAKQLGEQAALEKQSLGHRIHARFKALGDEGFVIPARTSSRSLPDFSSPNYSKKTL